jgi:hypothetical protein
MALGAAVSAAVPAASAAKHSTAHDTPTVSVIFFEARVQRAIFFVMASSPDVVSN